MKTKLIFTGNEKFVVVDESLTIVKDCYYFSNNAVRKCVEVKEGNYPYGHLDNYNTITYDFHTWKGQVITSNHITELPLCSTTYKEVCEMINDAEIESKCEVKQNPHSAFSLQDRVKEYRLGFNSGYKAAQSKGCYSEEDMVSFAQFIEDDECTTPINSLIQWKATQHPKDCYVEIQKFIDTGNKETFKTTKIIVSVYK